MSPDLKTMKPSSAREAKPNPLAVQPAKNSATAGKKGVSWSVINLVLDLMLFASFVLLCWLAALTQFVFPSGATGASWRLLGATVETWRSLQFGTLCVFAIEVLIHIMLHWSWVCGVVESRFLSRALGKRTTGDDGGRTLVGVILLAGTLLLMGAGLGVAAYFLQRVE
jgi:hypothetical protein